METAGISAIITLLELAIREEPAIAADLQKLFANGTPDAAAFASFRANVEAETYGEFVPNSDLPPSETGQ